MLGAQSAGSANLRHPEPPAGRSVAWKPRIAARVERELGSYDLAVRPQAGSCPSLGPSTLIPSGHPFPSFFPPRMGILNV